LLKKEEKIVVDILDDSDEETDRIGFVQHLSATKRFSKIQ